MKTSAVRDGEVFRSADIQVGDLTLRVGVVSGGQPKLLMDTDRETAYKNRTGTTYKMDEELPTRKSHENPEIKKIYKEFLTAPLGEKSLIITYTCRDRVLTKDEYTNTMIVYLDAYEQDMVPQGEINMRVFNKCRKLISQLVEFSNLNAGIK